MKKLKEYSKWVVAFIFAVAVITVYKTFDNIRDIGSIIGTVLSAFKPFFAAFIIAYVFNLPAKKISGLIDNLKFKHCEFIKKHSWGLSILIVYLIGVGALIWIACSLLPSMYMSLVDLVSDIPKLIDLALTKLSQYEIFGDSNLFENSAEHITKAINKLVGGFDASQVGKYAMGVVNITSGLLDFVIALIASVYMLLDKDRIKKALISFCAIFIKQERLDSVLVHSRQVNEIFTNYIYSRLICCGIMAAVSIIVLSLLDIKYALILGLFIGAMDLIPYFGSIIASVTAIAVSIITSGLIKGVTVAIILLILQQIDGNVLGPKVMGDTLEIRPLLIIIAVTVGGSLFGFIGMLISVPVVAVLRILFQEVTSTYEERVKK